MAEAINLYLQAAGTVLAASGNTPNLTDYDADELDLRLNITAVAGAGTIDLFLEELGLDGVWYLVYDNTVLGAVAASGSQIGPGLATNKTFGDTIRLRWVIGGTSVTCSISLTGRKTARTNSP